MNQKWSFQITGANDPQQVIENDGANNGQSGARVLRHN
jgi:hypothetical protein